LKIPYLSIFSVKSQNKKLCGTWTL
jgi:hypothetical protein